MINIDNVMSIYNESEIKIAKNNYINIEINIEPCCYNKEVFDNKKNYINIYQDDIKNTDGLYIIYFNINNYKVSLSLLWNGKHDKSSKFGLIDKCIFIPKESLIGYIYY